MIYDAADRAIKEMNRANLKAFGKLKLARFDELNVIREVRSVYVASTERAKRKYREIFCDAYFWMLVEMGYEEAEARLLANGAAADAVWEMLDRVDPVTLYEFMAEADRKRDRLIEALTVAVNRGREIDKALRLWTQQVAQYADNSVYYGRLQAMRDAGAEVVMWRTQEDEKVCEDCEPLDGQVFAIGEAPECPMHWHCRCVLIPIQR